MNNEIIGQIKNFNDKIRQNVERVIVGKSEIVEQTIVALLSGGHVLIEDVPGIGKTTLAKSIARSLGCSFRRVQCTPDLLPSDMTGTYIYNQKTSNFEFRPGPVMAQVLLADEINRATPRTQSALLEAMQERQVTIDGETKMLPQPFMVLATQNPIELEGTFPLPEAQLDRFLIKIKLGYPNIDDDRIILSRSREDDPFDKLAPVVSSEEILNMQKAIKDVKLAPDIENYIINLIHATREHALLQLGASPRAMLALHISSQALAALRGRTYVIPDDIKYLANMVLVHRIIPRQESYVRGHTAEIILKEIIDSVPVPVEDLTGHQ